MCPGTAINTDQGLHPAPSNTLPHYLPHSCFWSFWKFKSISVRQPTSISPNQGWNLGSFWGSTSHVSGTLKYWLTFIRLILIFHLMSYEENGSQNITCLTDVYFTIYLFIVLSTMRWKLMLQSMRNVCMTIRYYWNIEVCDGGRLKSVSFIEISNVEISRDPSNNVSFDQALLHRYI